jgi:hypothetical protein
MNWVRPRAHCLLGIVAILVFRRDASILRYKSQTAVRKDPPSRQSHLSQELLVWPHKVTD